MRWLACLAIAFAVAMTGCSPFGGGSFACAGDDECSGSTSAGICEPTGFCSFADGSCASGRRYGELAGGGLAGVCVGEEPDDSDAAPLADADPNAPDAAPDEPDAMVQDICDPQAGLVACYKFENDVLDSSGNGNDATATNDGYAAGVDGMALDHAANTAVVVPDDPDFDVSAFTVEVWIRPGQLPGSGGRMGILDVQGQYGLFLQSSGSIRCTAGGSLTSVATLPVGQFTHVACTADGATITVYVNGVELATGASGFGITDEVARIGSDSPSGGDELIGRMDNLRFWNTVRTRAQICADNPGACP